MVTTPDNALTKPAVYETKRIRLTSPMLHIGSEVPKLSPFEYVQTGKFVYLPNQEALAKVLTERGYLNDYIQQIEDRDDIVLLLEDALDENWWLVKDADGKPIFPREKRSLKWTDQRVTDLRPMIRNGFGQLYIPGTSIKGAMRTAIAYHLLKHADKYRVPKQQRISEIEHRLRQSMGNLRQKAKFMDDSLFMDNLFTDFDLIYQGQTAQGRKGPNTDFMRAVQVTDSDPLMEEKIERPGKRPIFRNLPIVAEVIVSSRFPDYRAKYRASIYTELVRNLRTEFTLSIDHEMLSWFHHSQGMQLPFQSVDDLLTLCQEFAQDQWDFEHDYWINIQSNPNADGRNLDMSDIRHLYEREQCPYSLRIGWASGMPGTTINMGLPEDLWAEVRDACGSRATGFEAPKSRRTVVTSKGEIKYVPGWVKLTVI